MGPRFHERGNECAQCGKQLSDPASMGPRFHERGNMRDFLREYFKSHRLQWGRAFTNAEMSWMRRR